MNDEKWQELISTLTEKFDVEKEVEEIIQKDDVGQEIINNVERLTFESPMGKMKVERTVRPKILDKKVHYSHTAGNKSMVEYVISPDEVTQKIAVFKFDEDRNDWEEINLSEGMRF